MNFTVPFVLKGEYSIPKNTIRKNRTGKTLVSLPDEEGPFFLETVFEESDQIGDELDEIFYEITYFFSQTLEKDIQKAIPGTVVEFHTEINDIDQSTRVLETGRATVSFVIKGMIRIVLVLSKQVQQTAYPLLMELFKNAVEHANEIHNAFTLHELSDLPNWKNLYIQLTYEDPLKETTKANSLARQQVRAITAFEGLPENVTRKIGSYITGPLNNSALRSRPLPKALTKEVLEMSAYERQQRGGRTRKQKKSAKRSRKTSRRR